MRSTKLFALLVVGAVTLAACGGGSNGDSGGGTDTNAQQETPEVPSGEVEYLATEFAFEGPDTIAAGETTFKMVNQGEQAHMLLMVELLQGKTIDDVNSYIKKNGIQGRPPSWTKQVKGLNVVAKPGKDAAAKPVNLTPGTYAMLCFIPDKKSKKPHALLGMTKELTVE